MELTQKLDYILSNITSLLTSELDQLLLEQLGISYSQYRVLSQISEEGIKKQNMIAYRLAQSEPSINRQLNILIDKSLVYKTIDTTNKKSKIVKLTSLGVRVRAASAKIVKQFNQNLLDGFDTKTIKLLEDNLAQLIIKLYKNRKHI